MVTMIIVEDEAFERNALKQCIDWNLIGVEIIGEASNGQKYSEHFAGDKNYFYQFL